MNIFERDTTTEEFARYYVGTISREIVSHPVADRVDFIRGVIQGMDRRIASGESHYKPFRKIFVGMKRDAKAAAKVAARATYTGEVKA